jgi:cytochrome c
LGVAAAVSPAAAQEAAHGKALFDVQCARCHALKRGSDDVYGPNLRGVVGRKAAREKGFDYSAAMRKSAIIWDWASLNAYLAQPRLVVPRTSMQGFGVPDPQDRRDLIAYLQSVH